METTANLTYEFDTSKATE